MHMFFSLDHRFQCGWARQSPPSFCSPFCIRWRWFNWNWFFWCWSMGSYPSKSSQLPSPWLWLKLALHYMIHEILNIWFFNRRIIYKHTEINIYWCTVYYRTHIWLNFNAGYSYSDSDSGTNRDNTSTMIERDLIDCIMIMII